MKRPTKHKGLGSGDPRTTRFTADSFHVYDSVSKQPEVIKAIA